MTPTPETNIRVTLSGSTASAVADLADAYGVSRHLIAQRLLFNALRDGAPTLKEDVKAELQIEHDARIASIDASE